MPDHAFARGRFPPGRTRVIVNRTAGRAERHADGAGVVLRELRDAGYSIEITDGPGRATDLARAAAGAEGLIVVGGDGTLYETLAGARVASALAVYPAGTVNLFARNLGVPFDAAAWLALLREGKTRNVYLGRANGRPFACAGSVGYDAWVVAHVNPALKRFLHEGAYAVTAATGLLRFRAPRLSAIVDGRTIDRPLLGVIVGKGPRFGGAHPVLSLADPADPSFGVMLLEGRRRRDLLRFARGMRRGTLPRVRGVTQQTAFQVEVRADPPAHVQLDGDAFEMTPVTFHVDPAPREVLAP